MGSQLRSPINRGEQVQTSDGDFNKLGGDQFVKVNGQLTTLGTFTNYKSGTIALDYDQVNPAEVYLTNKGKFNSPGDIALFGSVVNDGHMYISGKFDIYTLNTTFTNSNNATLEFNTFADYLELSDVTNLGSIAIAKQSAGVLFYGYIGGEGSTLTLDGPQSTITGTEANAINNGQLISGIGVNTFIDNFANGSKGVIEAYGFFNIINCGLTNSGQLINKSSSTLTVIDRSLLQNKGSGSITNLGKIVNDGTIDIREGSYTGNAVDNDGGKGRVIGKGTLSGSGTIVGDFDNDAIVSPGNSAGGHRFEGDFNHLDDGIKEIELGGSANYDFHRIDTEHDFIEVTGDLIIDGGKLEISLIDDFKLQRGQEFIIAKVDGELIGEYDGLSERASVGQFDSIYGNDIDLKITYASGDGNDIALYTDPSTNPEIIFGYM